MMMCVWVFQFMLQKSFCSISKKHSKSSVLSLRSVLFFTVLYDGAFKFSFLPLHNLTIRNFNGLNRQTLYFTKSGKKGKNEPWVSDGTFPKSFGSHYQAITRKAIQICHDPTHPLHSTVQLLPPGHRLRVPMAAKSPKSSISCSTS